MKKHTFYALLDRERLNNHQSTSWFGDQCINEYKNAHQRKFWNIFLVLIFLTMGFANSERGYAQTTIVGWDGSVGYYNYAIYDASNGIFRNPYANVGAAGNISISVMETFGGASHASASSWYYPDMTQLVFNDNTETGTWDNGSGTKGWVFRFSSVGYTTLKFSGKMCGWIDNSMGRYGPRDFKLQYSLNGSVWTDIAGGSITGGTANATTYTLLGISNVSLPVICDNTPTVYLRVIMTSNISADGIHSVTTGNSILDGFIVAGTPIPAPPTVTTNAANNLTSTSATLRGAVNANNASTAVTFEYGTTTSYGTTVIANQSPVTGSSVTSVNKAITGLAPSTTYYYRVIGVNSEGTANGSDKTFTTQAPPNNAPTDIALSANSINENVVANSVVGTLSSTDPDAANTFTYTLVAGTGDTDNTSFNISGSSLRISNSPNFETKSSYSVRVRTSDQGSLTYEEAFTITINNINETPTDIALSASSINENVVANSTVGALSSTDPDAANTFTYTLVAGTGSTDNTSFNISGSSLQISSSPDFETKSSYSVRVRTTDQGSLTYEEVFTITINDVNEAPTDIALSASSINENVVANSTVGALSSTDPDAANTFTYTLVAGTGSTDNTSFNISGSSLRISNSPNFETKSSYSVRVRTIDQGSLTYEEAFTITINNINETPTDIALSASSINENVVANSTVGTLSSTDPDAANTFTYTLVAGTGSTENSSFNISGSSLRITGSPDFETKSSYSVRVRTTDQGSLTYEEVFTITINDVNEAPTNMALSANSINENVVANSTVGTLSSTDPDSGNTFTYNLVAGTGSTDNSSFNISGSSLQISSSPDFETKSSYSVRVRTTDQGNLTYEEAFTIIINNLNESPTDLALSANSINENVAANSTVGTLSSIDPDSGNTFTYTLVAGTGSTDNFSFNISGSSLQINNSPDFETKSSYSVRVRTTDQGNLTYEEAFTITINDVNEAPTDIALSASSINENVVANSTVGTLSSTDPDAANTFTYTLVAGTGSTDNTSFNISGSSLQISSSPDFETKSSYSVRVRTTDQGSLTYEEVFTITINDVNEAPTDITLSASSIVENVPANTTVGTLSSTDQDSGNTFTYTLVAGAGDTDNASFNISGNSLRVTNSPDYTMQSSYSVRVLTRDQGNLTFEKSYVITIIALPKTPASGSNTYTYDGTIKTAIANAETGETIDWYVNATGSEASTAPSGTNVGTYSAYAEARNTTTGYVSANRTLITLEVTKATLTVTAEAKTKIYGAANPPLTFSYSGWQNGETESVLATVPTASTTVTVTSPVAVYTNAITASGGVDENYAFTYVPANLEVTKAPLTVTADAKTKCYDAAVYSGYTVTYTGFVNGEDQSVLGGALTFNGTAIDAVNPDTYSIVPAGLTSDNYNITFVNGTLVINPLPEPVISGPSSICAGSTTAVYTTVASMSQYVWSVSDGGTITSGAGTREITVSWTLAGEQRVLVTATNANGCSATDVKMVDVTALPTATLDEDVVICAGSSHTVSVALTGNAPWSISYTDGSFSKTVNGILKSPYTFTASPEVNTTKTYTVINVSDVNGCSNTGSGQAVIKALPGIDTNPVVSAGQTICFNSAPAELSATPAHGGSGVFTYQWQKKTTDTWTNVGTDALSYQPEALTTTTWFRLSATDKEGLSCGAVLSNEIAITVKSITSPGTLSADQLLAPGAKPATIMSMTAGSGDGAITYFWESSADKGLSWETIPGATSPDYAPATPNQPTWYRRVTVSTENSVVCTAATDPVKINLWATGIENPGNGLGILSAYAVRNTEICLKGEVSKQAVATLYDIQGRVVVVKNLEEGSLNTIPTPYIKTGVYLLFVKDNQRIHKFKIPVKE